MRRIWIFLFFFCPSFIFAQQPKSTEEITSQFNSIEAESAILYTYLKTAETAEALAFDSLQWEKNENSIFGYRKNQTLTFVILDDKDKCVMEMAFYNDHREPISTKMELRKLTDYEDSLITTKRELLLKSQEEIKLDTPKEGFDYEYVFVPSKSDYKLYILYTTKLKGVFPAGNNFLLSTHQMLSDNIRIEEFLHSMNSMEFDSKTSILILNYPYEMPMISAIDICKFNLYRSSPEQLLWVYSQYNRRTFVYNPKNHRITIKAY